MKIERLFLVIRARPHSILEDVLVECNVRTLCYMILGGLRHDEILGIYTKRDEAASFAKQELDRAKGFRSVLQSTESRIIE